MRRVTASAAAVLLLAVVAHGQEKPAEAPPRRHNADPSALDLVRKADRATYRPTDAGVKTLRCRARYVMTNGTAHVMAYAMEAPGKSTLALQSTAGDAKGAWHDEESERYRVRIDDLLDGPRLEKRLAPYELALADDGDKLHVVATRTPDEKTDRARLDLRFLAEGPLAEESSPSRTDPASLGYRFAYTYEREGGLHVRRRNAITNPEYADGTEAWQYEKIDGLLLPTKYVASMAGLGGTLTLSDFEVNVAVTGPATLPPPSGPPTQETLDALDVEALRAKLREPFVGPAPDPVTTLRLVRALAKKGDDARSAVAQLVWLLRYGRPQPPKTDAPKDFEDFHRAAVELLVRLRPESIRALTGALQSPVTDQRMWAADALGRIGPDAASATERLLVAVGDKMWMVGQAAATALRQIGCPAETALPRILRQADVWWMGEGWADEAIAYAAADPDGDRKLVAAFVDGGVPIERNDDGRVRGVEVLFRKHGAKLVDLLVDAARPGDAALRGRIARALAVTGRPAFTALATWIEGDDAVLRAAALDAAPWAGKDAGALAPKIAPLLASTDVATADAAASSLVRIGAPAREAVEAFLATRPADGEDVARDRARKVLSTMQAK